MRKLLSANFSRLWKSKIFWVLEGISTILGAIFYVLAIINTRNIGVIWYENSGNYYFFLELVYVGVVMAIFSSLYIGTEYSDGTIRNKLTVGHSRKDIYLANLIVNSIAGLLFTITHIVASLCVGLPFFGGLLWKALAPVGWRIATGIILILCYGAIFTFLAILDSSKSRNAIISFALALAIALGGLYTFGRLQEPKITTQMVMQEDGSFLREEVENKNYLDGTTRQVYMIVDALLPSSQALNIARSEGQFSPLSVVCLLGVTAAFTGAGVTSFKKKDIK